MQDPRTLWRLYYKLPKTDPLVQNVTDEEVLEDLLEVFLYNRSKRAAEETPNEDARRLLARLSGPEGQAMMDQLEAVAATLKLPPPPDRAPPRAPRKERTGKPPIQP